MKRVLTVALGLVMTGCAAMNSINNKEKLNSSTTVLAVDAKQRFAVSSDLTQGTPNKGTCLEPSPDVFSAISSAFEGSVSKADDVSAALQAAMSEGAATIGVRTQTIQLIRDAMYRICEGYLTGGIDGATYRKLHQDYQRSMVTLSAVSALADSARPVQVAITGNALVTGGGLMARITEDLDTEESKLATKKSELAAAQKDSKERFKLVCDADADCVKTPEEQKAARVEAICNASNGPKKDDASCVDYRESDARAKSLAESEKASEDTVTQLKKELADAKKQAALSAGTVVTTLSAPAQQTDPESVKEVAKVVDNLVRQVYEHDLVTRCLALAIRKEQLAEQIRKQKERDPPEVAALTELESSMNQIESSKLWQACMAVWSSKS